MIRKRKGYTISLDIPHLMAAGQDRIRTVILLKMQEEAIRSTILRAEIWTIFLEICLIIFFTADSPAVSKTVDLKAEDLAKMDFTGRGLTAVSL